MYYFDCSIPRVDGRTWITQISVMKPIIHREREVYTDEEMKHVAEILATAIASNIISQGSLHDEITRGNILQETALGCISKEVLVFTYGYIFLNLPTAPFLDPQYGATELNADLAAAMAMEIARRRELSLAALSSMFGPPPSPAAGGAGAAASSQSGHQAAP